MSQTLEALVVELRADVKGLQTSLQAATRDVQRFSNSSAKAVDGFQEAVSRARMAVVTLGAAWAGFGIGKNIVNAGLQMQALDAKMKAATGSSEVAANSLAFVRAEADRLGLDVRSTADGFSSFAASALRSGLTLDQVKAIFSGVSEATVGLRLSTERTQLVFTALSQMASKGTVSMEDLKQQMGESLPGALQVFSKAMGVTNDAFIKMITNGQVTTTDLVKLGSGLRNEFGAAAEEAAQGAQAAFNKLGNAFFDLKAKLADSGFLDTITEAVKDLTTQMNDPQTVEGLKGFATLLADIASAAVSAAIAVGKFYNSAQQRKSDLGDYAKNRPMFSAIGRGIGLADGQDSQTVLDNATETRSLRERVLAEFKAKQAAIAAAKGASDDLGGYSLGSTAQPSESDNDKKARERAAKQAELLKTQMQGQVESFQYNRADPEEQAALDVEKQQKMLKKALEAKAITEEEYRDLGLQAETDYQDRLTEIRKEAADKEIENRQRAADQETAIRENAMNNAVNLLNVFANKNKAIAIALLVFEKARAIAQAIIATHVAATTALIYDPTGATSARVTAMGYANVALIAATGIAQLATMGSGGGAGGGGSSASGTSSGSDSNSSINSSRSSQVAKSVYITLNGDDAALYSKTTIRKLIEGINDAIGDGSKLNVAVAS